MDFATRYKSLNENQRLAVDTIDGPVMVIAGPGTGKTELLSMRAANILKQTDTLAENILCLTFTDSGANAMRERLVSIIGPEAYKIAIHTFHSFGTEIINQNGQFFYQGANFRAADELSSYELMRSIFDELDYNSPLASKMNDQYTHLRDALTTISELKRSGLTSDELLTILDANDDVIETVEPLLRQIFAARISKTTANALAQILPKIRASGGAVTQPGILPLSTVIADSLENAIVAAANENSTKPITAWRNQWMKKDSVDDFILKSRERQIKLRSLSYLYYQYLSKMQESELYDFDDMILRVVHAMEIFPELRYNLQEKYQYIMVDEFQDTNLAQMRILHDLTDNPANEGKPNVLVVGDDDQAIYSFQGADIGNINSFYKSYDSVKRITLTDNYRSSEAVLERARGIITQSQDRLESKWEDIDKTLTAHYQPDSTSVELVELEHASDERQWLVNTISEQIKAGAAPDSIAVLARRHHEILDVLPYFARENIRVNYERSDSVLDSEVIQTIQLIAQAMVAIYEKRFDVADSLMPQILSHPAFAIEPTTIWQLSLSAKRSQRTWLETMAITPELLSLHGWLINSSMKIPHTSLERMLDIIIGHDEASDEAEADYVCPLFTYYFSETALERDPDAYLVYLESLRTIRTKLREYKPNENPSLQTLLDFIRMHQELGSTITSIRARKNKSSDAVNLMTAHKSKGLEYESVYIIGAIDSAWGERVRSRSRLIAYPENLPLAPAGDTLDERLRLFFVAATRARKNLTISYSTSNDNGKSTLQASFLSDENWPPQTPDTTHSIADQTANLETEWYQSLVTPIKSSMQDVLQSTLDNYQLSSTHLNNFLDITRGGPHHFLMTNLLRFPQAISPSAGYGSAVHAALQRAHSHLTATGELRPVEDVLHDFEESLRSQHLNEEDFSTYLQKGTDSLASFLDVKYGTFSKTQKTELSFSRQNVFVGEAHLTGSLDLVDITDKNIIITDYKTGKAAANWSGKTDYEKIKLHKYKQQLMFYYLLIQNSRDWANYSVEKGVLQFVEPTPRGDIIALEQSFSQDDLENFKLLVQSVWRCIVNLDLPDTSHYDSSYKGIVAFEEFLIDKIQ